MAQPRSDGTACYNRASVTGQGSSSSPCEDRHAAGLDLIVRPELLERLEQVRFGCAVPHQITLAARHRDKCIERAVSSLLLDIKILFKTVSAFRSREGAR